MTLLITIFAAAIATIFWYNSKEERLIGVLAFIYWGASFMWLVDAVSEYAAQGAEYFNQTPEQMLNDGYLGLSVVALGLVIWIIILLIKDPAGKFKSKKK